MSEGDEAMKKPKDPIANGRLDKLLAEVRDCRVCEDLPLGPRPVLRAAQGARVLVIGQAPGTRVHESGVPWDDPSGERLRQWLAVDAERFYDESLFAIIPMGFCYPGRGKSGDLPPRPECADLWHERLLAELPEIELTLLIGQYAQARYLGDRREKTLTATVQRWRDYLPEHLPISASQPAKQPLAAAEPLVRGGRHPRASEAGAEGPSRLSHLGAGACFL